MICYSSLHFCINNQQMNNNKEKKKEFSIPIRKSKLSVLCVETSMVVDAVKLMMMNIMVITSMNSAFNCGNSNRRMLVKIMDCPRLSFIRSRMPPNLDCFLHLRESSPSRQSKYARNKMIMKTIAGLLFFIA